MKDLADKVRFKNVIKALGRATLATYAVVSTFIGIGFLISSKDECGRVMVI